MSETKTTETQYMDLLFLELSQFTKAKTATEIRLEKEIDELRDKAELYEVVRRMNPHQFADAWKLNLSLGKPFDEIIRECMRDVIGKGEK